VAAWFPDMFCNFYLVKNYKISKNSTTTKARKKYCTDLESLEFLKLFDVSLTKFKNNKTLLNKLATDLYWQPSYLLGERKRLIIPQSAWPMSKSHGNVLIVE
jgi:hypothetical protein